MKMRYNICVRAVLYPARILFPKGRIIEMSYNVTPDTIIGDILDMDRDTAPYFLEIGMHCLGCPASRGESIADACAVHGTDANALVAKLNEHFAKKA